LLTGIQKGGESVEENAVGRSPEPLAHVSLTATPARFTPPPRRLNAWFLSPAVFLFTAGATFLLLFFRTGSVTASTPEPGPVLDPRNANLEMRVETDGPGLLLSWNRYSSAARAAQTGVLAIQDGSQHRNISLDRNQIVDGSVFYRPVSDDVSFRLDLRDARGTEISQILRVLDSAPRKVSAEPTAVEASAAPARMPVEERPREFAVKPAVIQQKTPAPVQLGSAQPPVPAPPTALAPPPTADPVTNVLQLPTPANAVAPSPAVTPEPATRLVIPGSSKEAPAREAPAYVPPKPLKWVQPNLAMSQPLDIKVKVRIDETGHVTAAHALIEGPKRDRKLLAAAAAAVREWTFEPAKAHGANVPCEETIVIHLGPEAQ